MVSYAPTHRGCEHPIEEHVEVREATPGGPIKRQGCRAVTNFGRTDCPCPGWAASAGIAPDNGCGCSYCRKVAAGG